MRTIFLPLVFIIFFSFSGVAQQLTYEPLNPAFGGVYYNYSWLLSSATAQNGFKAPVNQREQQSELDRLGQNINSQILSQLSRTLMQQQLEGFGSFDEEGTFTYGTLSLEIYRTLEGLVINILDTSNGEETQIIVPN